MMLIEEHCLSKRFHEVQMTINNAEGFAEIVEVYSAGEDGSGYIVITSIKAIKPNANVPDFAI